MDVSMPLATDHALESTTNPEISDSTKPSTSNKYDATPYSNCSGKRCSSYCPSHKAGRVKMQGVGFLVPSFDHFETSLYNNLA
jgi:hypothetical protein